MSGSRSYTQVLQLIVFFNAGGRSRIEAICCRFQPQEARDVAIRYGLDSRGRGIRGNEDISRSSGIYDRGECEKYKRDCK